MARSNKKSLKKRAFKIMAKLKPKSKVKKKPMKAKVSKKIVQKIRKISSKKSVVKKTKKVLLKKSQPKKVIGKKVALKPKTVKKAKVKVVAAKAPVKRIKVIEKKSVISPKGSATGPLGISPYKLQKDEEYMGEKQLQHFEQILNLWKQQLMQEVDRTIYDMQGVVNYPDQVDRASQEEEFSLKLRERDRERKLLKKIDEALLRIKNGEYGYCDECGAEIGIRRLEARPIATQCIECKTIAELREKQIGG